ncbi:cytochrome b561 bacterial/ni-hydrogenase [Lucifera butyrica]|uniref:Cytochrome b561 bacterial/ni-hydrogenase n=1 Tax=Lucifera butyrica TaxID=1351585 RepID=A0A498RB61_9FIRM|nr:cytochrome b/b6 domain-containing protein [Lucifera butyrica]VBB06358.1 cytochrome b561 bacterial/ni-hydrogenase [Lucifera butyrica]
MKLLLQPLPVRIFHWTMFSCVMTLLITGLYLHNPGEVFRLPLSLVRKIHGMFGMVLIFNLLAQIYYYSVTGKFTEIIFLPRDWKNIRSFMRYVLFITEYHPNYGRYNPGQKGLFTLWGIAVLTASVTSMMLLFPDQTILLQRWVGGLQRARVIHFFIAAFFGATVPLHLYLVFTEDPAKLQAMFTGYIKKEPGNKGDM